ncbi:pulmonary surfactant-associated protein A-like isoform X2 [Hyla sarda]|nr:pulmonary surfactant-associated protein A-like isoform X2 [Hyla sarda]XP_056386941.1 pulmonary surfactant-associated protein A-like isoform X2 [Hyla sarda]XP_056386943.1 pulmonary surfactant-associated protein A-like isoform X2 [Hyla sarda]XP_056386944.1 pulmonary surfactant-associated protein A-like isoform X2 [Hyla sarda]XP_056386945.1 pulmonary surfactant-associated protein A-like isoform X2 [Hyla sarda]
MLFHGSLLLTVVIGLVSCFPNPFGFAKPQLVPDLPNPLLPKVDTEIPNVSGGILDYIGLTGLLRFLGLLKTPVINAGDSLPLLGGSGVLGYKQSLPNLDIPGAPAVGGSSTDLQDLNRRISRLERVLKLEGRIQMVGNKMIATSGNEADFATSNSTCNDVGGRIVTPTNEVENAAVLTFVKKYNRYAYLGMRGSSVPGIFNYLNGIPAVYTHWRKGEPSGKATEGCIEMYTDGQWNDKTCNQNRLTICEF